MSTRFTIANMIEELHDSRDITPRQLDFVREFKYKSCNFTFEEIKSIVNLHRMTAETTRLTDQVEAAIAENNERDFDAEANDREQQIDNNGETVASVQPNIAPKDNVSLPPVSLPSNGL